MEAFGMPFSQTVTGQINSSVLQIPINFYETRNDVIIELGLPGYAREDVEVSINGRRLKLIAKPHASEGFLESKVYSHNFAHVNLDREIELPEFLDASNVQVSMNYGLLRVVVQRRNEEEQKLTISEHTDQYLRDSDGA
jgi:HSP20 family molecular chaperone IbpA